MSRRASHLQRTPVQAWGRAAWQRMRPVACCVSVVVCAVSAQAQSVAKGQALFESRCVACHSLDEHRVGPALRGVVGRKAGKVAGYSYSTALASASHVWSESRIRDWLANPEDVVPGQRMNYRLDSPQDRADVAAYLASLSKPVTK